MTKKQTKRETKETNIFTNLLINRRMKKNLFFAMAAATLLAGCSKDSSVENATQPVEPIDPNAPVEIQLNAGGISASVTPKSRAAVDAWNNTEIGVFAVNKNSTDLTATDEILMNNQKAQVAAPESGQTAGIISWLNDQDATTTLYYPSENTRAFTFYGYHPYETDANSIATTTTSITKTYQIDGTKDIMWGKAEAEDVNGKGDDSGSTYSGYNAQYFRKGDGATTPNLTFKHLLTQLQFQVTQGTDYTAIPNKSFKITGITVSGNTSLDLTVADLTTPTNSGTISVTETGSIAQIAVKENDQSDLQAIDIDNITGTPTAGQGIMLYTDENTIQFTAQVTTQLGDDEAKATNVTIKLDNNAAFEAGKAYKVTLKMNSLMEITATATLTQWEPVDGPTIEM